jgi:sugar lactone lactonase YvrE
MTKIYDTQQCSLGEGALWHPLREELFWFDINAHQLLSRSRKWQFSEYVSAAGWISKDELFIASQSKLFSFNLQTETHDKICDLESNEPNTRSNDGRADPKGGFWIGTMSIQAEPQVGKIYRYYRGKLVELISNLTIPNAICFSPDGKMAYFADTPKHKIMAMALDDEGWPKTKPTTVVDLTKSGEKPDGAVVDSDGNIWNAQWGSARVACYSPKGFLIGQVRLTATNTSCPAFAGETNKLYCTSATDGILPNSLKCSDGQTFEMVVNAVGQREHQVVV